MSILIPPEKSASTAVGGKTQFEQLQGAVQMCVREFANIGNQLELGKGIALSNLLNTCREIVQSNSPELQKRYSTQRENIEKKLTTVRDRLEDMMDIVEYTRRCANCDECTSDVCPARSVDLNSIP